MNFDPKAVRRALMVAKNLAASIDPGFANINVPMPPEGVPLERAAGGSADAPQIGINVRSDTKAGIRYADEIVDGNKAYETRDTDSLRPYVGKRVAIVRTGEGPAKAIGEVTVGKPIVADQDMFHRLRDQHLVPAGSAFDIKPGSTKHLYPMHDPVRYDNERGVGAGIVARKVMERAEGGKTDPDLQTAQRLGFDTSSIPEIRRAGELSKFHQSMMGSVSETAQKMQDLGNEYHQSGLLPHPIGTLLHTPFSKKNGQPPLRITGHYVDPKNPSRYGYMFEQGESSGTAMVSDPKADERIRKTNPDWDREEYWSQAQPLTGPQGFAKAEGGAVDEEVWPYPIPEENMLQTHHAQRYGQGLPEGVVPEDMFDPRSNPGIGHGTGPFTYAAEHIGDLVHRLSYVPRVGGGVEYGIEAAYTKARRNYDLRQDRLNESLKSNYKFHKDNGIFNGTFDEYLKQFDQAANRYADAYRLIPVHTELQKFGRDAAVALGERNFPKAQQNLNEIKRRLENENVYEEYWRPLSRDIKKAEGGLVDNDDEIQPRNLNPMGLYSVAADAARALPQGVGTPQQMLASLKGVNPDELQWSGAQQAFANKPRVTKDELAQHFEENLPTLRVNSLEEDDAQAAINKYEDYNLRLPGGSNYKEDLIHLNRGNELKRQTFYTPDPNLVAIEKPRDYSSSTAPFLFSDKKYEIRDASGKLLDEISGPYTNSPGGALDSYHRKQAYRKENDWKKLNTFQSPHYDDQNNIVAHVRRADRRGPGNEKILHLEEVQSDWGQTARDKGLNNPIVPGTVVKEENTPYWRINWPDNTYSTGFRSPEEAQQKAESRAIEKSNYVPSGPYIDTTSKWTDVALKHALNEAAKGNYDSIIWTPGDVQADRYDLSQHVDSISHAKRKDGTYDIGARAEGEHRVMAASVPENKLSSYVGKDLAQKIIKGYGDELDQYDSPDGAQIGGWREIYGKDLKVGGAGMKSYYDKILPGRLLALAQEHDPKAKLETLNHPRDEHVNGFPMLKITPRMRESIKKRGFKAFSTGGFAMPKPVDADKAVRRALMIARATGGKVSTFQQMADAPPADPSITPTANPKRLLFSAEGKGGVKGIVVPRHMWEGAEKTTGMRDINKARAEVYGAENRDPLTLGQISKIHKQTLEDHFAKPVAQQIADEKAALQRLRAAKHIAKDANTLDESEKLDTVRHERDDQGRTYVAYASKGIAGHALYTSGYGDNEKKMVLNTCPGQTTGCGGGISPDGVVDTSKGTCFAPNAESQYPGAAVRRACHAQAKHDPAMTQDWILAHTGSLRNAAKNADRSNQVVLFRPNVVDETDTTSRYVIQNLNKQRQAEGKPGIIANSYGKTNELHDPENGYFVTHSNVGPKTKLGASIAENISRDNQRIRSTIDAADARGKDFTNDNGNLTPPKNSYMVTDVKRYSPLDQAMQQAITHAKYWSTGREQNQLSDAELAEGPEGHFDGSGNPTTPDMAHYGHTTLNGRRYDYQKQHILHPRMVQVGNNDDGTPHMIPTDSRFKDNEFLPEDRFMTKNGKQAGAILMTTPTTSTSAILHQSPFTHHVDDSHVQYALQNNGEYQIDPPDQQEASRGKEYMPPQPVFFRAEGGRVDNIHVDRQSDDPHAFPEQNFVTQMHMAKRLGDDESHLHEVRKGKKPLPVDAANVEKALQVARKFSPVPGMMVTIKK